MLASVVSWQIVGSSPGLGKPQTLKLVCIASPPSTKNYGVRAKTGWLGIGIVCPTGATCLTVDYYYGELAVQKPKSAS